MTLCKYHMMEFPVPLLNPPPAPEVPEQVPGQLYPIDGAGTTVLPGGAMPMPPAGTEVRAQGEQLIPVPIAAPVPAAPLPAAAGGR